MKNPLTPWIGLMAGVLICSSATAETFFITDTNDTVRPSSLRGAIIAANRKGGANTIILGNSRRNHQPWVYHLSISGTDEDTSLSGDLDIVSGRLTIIGRGNVTIDATGLGDRVFQVFSNAQLRLKNLTITGGTARGGEYGSFDYPPGYAQSGGAVYNAGFVALDNCAITNNVSGVGSGNLGNGGGQEGADGGAIYNAGTLFANECVISGNFCGYGFDGMQGGNGGGIANDGICFLNRSIIRNNLAGPGGGPAGNAIGAGGGGGGGGGIFNNGTMTLENCLVDGNGSGQGADGGDADGNLGGPGGKGGSGAGIYNNSGKMQLRFSTVCSNACGSAGNGRRGDAGGFAGKGGNGGGIYNSAELKINTCTISSNQAGNGGSGGEGFFDGGSPGGGGGNGGGIYNKGSLDLTSCTIAWNQTGSGGNGGNGSTFLVTLSVPGGKGGDGGGISNGSNIKLRNTLIGLNIANGGGLGGTNSYYMPGFPPGGPLPQVIGDAGAAGIGFDTAGNFVSEGFNLVSTGSGSAGFANGTHADQVGDDANPIDLQIGPLQMNGGFTPTHALLSGSPAIDQGNSFGIHFDQRHRPRRYDYPSIVNSSGGNGADIGAFEQDEP